MLLDLSDLVLNENGISGALPNALALDAIVSLSLCMPFPQILP